MSYMYSHEIILAAAVAPYTRKIINNNLDIFKRGENLLQNILDFVFK